MAKAVLSRSERWEWSTEPEKLLLPADRAGDEVLRIRYRPHGGRTFRSFLLIADAEVGLTNERIVVAIDEHAGR